CFTRFLCQAEDGIRGFHVTGVQTCALPIFLASIVGDLARRGTKRAANDIDTRLLIVIGGLDAIERLEGAQQRNAAPRQDAFLDRSEERRVGRERRAGRWAAVSRERAHTRSG